MNTVKKGAGRPAATARSNRHAQRTPLPPRPGQVEAAKAPVDSKPSGKRTQTGDPITDPKPGDSKSWQKAKQFLGIAKGNGWSTVSGNAEGTEPSEDVVEVTVTRGDEVIWISWTSGGLTLDPMPTYTIADRTIKLRNASQAKQYASRSTEIGKSELERVSSNKFFRRKAVEPKRGKLPFDPKLATDEEVISALLGMTVTWHNNLTQGSEVGHVGRDAHKVRLAERNGDRIFSFCCPATGFRAFYLSALMKVRRG